MKHNVVAMLNLPLQRVHHGGVGTDVVQSDAAQLVQLLPLNVDDLQEGHSRISLV